MRLFDWFRRQRTAAAPPPIELADGPPFAVVTAEPRAFEPVAWPRREFVARPEHARTDWVVLAAGGTVPTPDALAGFATAIAQAPDADFVFADELDPDGKPWHKPGWSPALLLAQPYAARLFALRRELLAEVVDPRSNLSDAALYDLALRATAAAARVVHLPRVLSQSLRLRVPSDPHLVAAANAARAAGLSARVHRCPRAPVHRVSVRPQQRQPITVIVPTRDRLDLLRPCLQSVLASPQRSGLRLLIVDNGSVDPATLAWLAELQSDPRVRVLRDDGPFDFAALTNRAVAAATTPLVLLLNNDTKVISPDWLDELAGWLDLPDVGAVGAKLYHADGTIQHAGVLLGVGGVAAHGHQGLDGDAPGYHGLLHSVRDVSAVTAACMLMRRDQFLEVGGMEPALRVAYNDVDLCLKLRARGLRVLWTPLAELYHFEGQSRGRDRRGAARFEQESAWLRERWGPLLDADPFYNPNLSRRSLDYRPR